MMLEALITELLDRVAASHGAPVLIGVDELADWPAAAVAALNLQSVIKGVRPAASAVCPGDERECVMPVHTQPGAAHAAGAFIVCGRNTQPRQDNVRTPTRRAFKISPEGHHDHPESFQDRTH